MADYRIRQVEVDNGIIDVITKRLIALGYWFDANIYTTAAQQKTQKEAIVNSGKQVIEPLSTGSGQSKGEENINNICLDRTSPTPSLTGVGISWDYDWNDATQMYDKSKLSDSKFNIRYLVTFITTSADYADIIEDILRDCFGIRKMVKAINSQGEEKGEFWLYWRDQIDKSLAGFIERTVIYEAMNIDLMGSTNEGEIAALQEFNLGLATLTEENQNPDEAIDQMSLDIEIENGNP